MVMVTVDCCWVIVVVLISAIMMAAAAVGRCQKPKQQGPKPKKDRPKEHQPKATSRPHLLALGARDVVRPLGQALQHEAAARRRPARGAEARAEAPDVRLARALEAPVEAVVGRRAVGVARHLGAALPVFLGCWRRCVRGVVVVSDSCRAAWAAGQHSSSLQRPAEPFSRVQCPCQSAPSRARQLPCCQRPAHPPPSPLLAPPPTSLTVTCPRAAGSAAGSRSRARGRGLSRRTRPRPPTRTRGASGT